MKTKHMFIGGLLISASLINAQTSGKPATVRIKKIENINGVERVSDSTFTSTDPSKLKLDDGNVDIEEWTDKDGKVVKKIVIGGPDDKNKQATMVINVDGNMSPEEEKALIEKMGDNKVPMEKGMVRIKTVENINGVEKTTDTTFAANDMAGIKMPNIDMKELTDPANGGAKKTIIIHHPGDGTEGNSTEDKMAGQHIIIKKTACGASKEEIEKAPVAYHIVINRKIEVTEMSQADKALLGKTTGLGDNKLALDKLDFYPNPNDGKFNLRFNLKAKGNTEVSILNIEGKSIYSESLKDFTGSYDKPIDISKEPKGVYFVKVIQGSHSQLKKIVVE